MESLDFEALTPTVEIPYDSSGTSPGTIPIYRSPRVYKKKFAKVAGFIQIACGMASLICGIVMLCELDLRITVIRIILSYPGVIFGIMYCANGVLGLATIRREYNHRSIKRYMISSIFSSFFAGVHFSLTMIGLSFDSRVCYPDDDVDFCALTKAQRQYVGNIYSFLGMVGFVDFITSIFAASLTCHVACCNSETTPYRIIQNEGGGRLTDSSGSSLATVAILEGPSTSDGQQAYPIIPRTDLNLIKQIGHGGYSEVYLAKWNNHDVAAKRLHEECKREAEVLARLAHPNIVKLIGVVDEKFDFFLVLELSDRGSLRSYLNDNKDQPLGLQFYDWAKQAARPITYLKEKKIVHKDIKSPNFLLASCGALKLGDFGLAKNVDITISRATETASYPWMAPELLRDNILSPKYDVFAYGIVLWELWTRQMPFEDVVEPAHLAWRICNHNERPQIPTDCPKLVADLMRLCWETDWKMRPNMDKVLSQLASAEEEAIANFSK